MFKVVPDQLRISEGWVRCGQCDEIFDASANLQQDVPAGVSSPDRTDHQQAVPMPQTHEAAAAREAQPGSDSAPLVQPAAEPVDIFLPLQAPPAEDVTSLDEIVPLAIGRLGADPDAAEARLSQPSRVDVPDVAFMRGQKTGTLWRRPAVRVALMLAGLLLLAGLAGQVMLHERDRIAAAAPGLKPWLQAACSVLKCSISPLRQIELIVIDSSSFSKIRGDAYRLNVTLKNTASTELAVPAIELTLTDSQDQPVLRRVFFPADFGAPSRVLAAGSELAGSLAVSVRSNGSGERIAGYRVLAFYP